MTNSKIYTILCDIDGTLIKHNGDIMTQHLGEAELLPGVKEKIIEWDRGGFRIILTTGRRESVRKDTEKQLAEVGIIYDQLIMGLGNSPRILINDFKVNSIEPTASVVNVERNKGLKGFKI